MPENHDERGSFDEQDLDEEDNFDDFDDEDDEPGQARYAWPATGSALDGFPPPPGQGPGGRGWLLAMTAVVAAALAFGVVDFAVHEASDSPAASATPSASAPAGNGSADGPSGGFQHGPGSNGAPPSGAAEHLMIGGRVTAVSATSITLGGGAQPVTAAVTHATKVSGNVSSIGGIKVGDLVSASISGTSGGKLTADSIQDPASLPAAPGQ